ncbi:MAG: DUF3043 domain-containing protein, partial [Dermatophilaceae bacterium]
MCATGSNWSSSPSATTWWTADLASGALTGRWPATARGRHTPSPVLWRKKSETPPEASDRRDHRKARHGRNGSTAAGVAQDQGGMISDDDATLLTRDRGPTRRYIRDAIDGRFSLGEVMLAVADDAGAEPGVAPVRLGVPHSSIKVRRGKRTGAKSSGDHPGASRRPGPESAFRAQPQKGDGPDGERSAHRAASNCGVGPAASEA